MWNRCPHTKCILGKQFLNKTDHSTATPQATARKLLKVHLTKFRVVIIIVKPVICTLKLGRVSSASPDWFRDWNHGLGNLEPKVGIRYVEIALIFSIETCKEVTQLVSTSNKRSSSGEMKIDLKRVGIYRGDGLDT